MTAMLHAHQACCSSKGLPGRGPLSWDRGRVLRVDRTRDFADRTGATVAEAAERSGVRTARGPLVVAFTCGGPRRQCVERLRSLRAMLPRAASLVAMPERLRAGRGRDCWRAWRIAGAAAGPAAAARPLRAAPSRPTAAADGIGLTGRPEAGGPYGTGDAAPVTCAIAGDALRADEENQEQPGPPYLTAALERLRARSAARLSDVARWIGSPPAYPADRGPAARVGAPAAAPSRGH